ncbi:hypothetical protein CRYO30217_01331 [Parvicella tangerina]|uniref:Uncharacterized protein n=1 Tax=Parvicella tangerina TaxID=2829795 RepID=A0A916JLV4_9FLAO|nr:hypothetical protein CRYO30217_01331 [Parvicella tangerina]
MSDLVIKNNTGYIRFSDHYIYFTFSDSTRELKHLRERTNLTCAKNKSRIQLNLLFELCLIFLFLTTTLLTLPLIIVFPGLCILTPIAIARVVGYFKIDFNCIFLIPYHKIYLIKLIDNQLEISFRNGDLDKDMVVIKNLNEEDIKQITDFNLLEMFHEKFVKC